MQNKMSYFAPLVNLLHLWDWSISHQLQWNSQMCLIFNFTFLTFQIKSWSNGNRWQSIVNIMLLNLSASCCNFTGRIALHIKISSKFDVDVCVTFLSLNWCGHHKEPCSFGILFEVLCIKTWYNNHQIVWI